MNSFRVVVQWIQIHSKELIQNWAFYCVALEFYLYLLQILDFD